MKRSFLSIALGFLIIILLSSLVLGQRDESAYIFQRASCECYDGLTLQDTTLQGSLLGCEYWEKRDNFDNPKIRTETWAHISSEKRLEDKKEYNQKEYDRLRENYIFEEFYVEEDRTAMLFQEFRYDPKSNRLPSRKGSLLHHYRGYSISVYAEDLDWNAKEDFAKIDECMMQAVDQAIIRQAAKESDKPKLTFVLEGRPLTNMYVNSDQGSFYSDEFGQVMLNENVRWIDIYFKYVSNKEIFSLQSSEGDEFLLDMRVDDGVITDLEVEYGSESFDLKIVDADIKNFKLEDYTDQIGLYLYNYMYFQDAAEYYEGLGVEFSEPVAIKFANSYRSRGSYHDNVIVLDASRAGSKKFNPYTQYHEFSHFVMHTLYGDIFTQITKEKNHGGYANPSTADSWAEGFAAFMAVQIANYHGHYWADYPSETNPSLYPYAGSLETNYVSWEHEGLTEEFAIASFLWDLVDDEQDIVDVGVNGGLDIAFALYFKSSDNNYDGVLTKDEYVLQQLREAGNDAELDEVDWLGMIEYGEILSGTYDVTPDMSLFEKYKGDDEALSFDELLSLSDGIMKYEFKTDVAKEWIERYDEDGDKQISLEEANLLLEGYEIIKFISDGKEILDMDDLEVLSQDPVISDVYWEFEKEAYTYDELFKKMTAHMYREDDENLNMDFDVLWELMIGDHLDFTSFIDDLSESNDENYQIKLAYSLLAHGLYADLTPGDGTYETGVEAFIDTNNDGERQDTETFIDYPSSWHFDGDDFLDSVTTYQRPDRRSSPVLPGHFVLGATEVAYLVWDGPVLKDYYLLRTDGYVPVPPGVSVYAANEDSVVHFTEKAFTQNYDEIKAQGYITELSSNHKFPVGLLLILLCIVGGFYLFMKKRRDISKTVARHTTKAHKKIKPHAVKAHTSVKKKVTSVTKHKSDKKKV